MWTKNTNSAAGAGSERRARPEQSRSREQFRPKTEELTLEVFERNSLYLYLSVTSIPVVLLVTE